MAVNQTSTIFHVAQSYTCIQCMGQLLTVHNKLRLFLHSYLYSLLKIPSCNVEARQRYNEAKLEARKLVRKAKNDEWVQFGKELEKDAKGNQPRFWARVNGNRMTKESMTRINGKNGQVLSEGAEVIGRWKEHFEELFHEMGEPLSDTQCSEAMQEDDMGIMKEEVRNGVKRLKMRKAPGICGILPEMLKAGGEVVIE